MEPAELRSFGRRRGRKLSPRQRHLLADLLPRVAVDLDNLADFATGEVWLEIGFGGGEHLIARAEQQPAVTLIGCEPFEEGIVKVLAAIDSKHLHNVRLHADDARPLLRALPANSLDRVFILFPDPWPKKRHAKRRLVSPGMLAQLARAMKGGARLRVATDIADYVRTILLAVHGDSRFAWCVSGPADWTGRPADWVTTRYEQKALREGRRCYVLEFERT